MNEQHDIALEYSPDALCVTQRLGDLMERRGSEGIFAVMNTPSKALENFALQSKEGSCDYPDVLERFAFWDDHLRSKKNVFDDSIPSAYLTECDQGVYGGIVGGEVRYMCMPQSGWVSSMVPPILKDWCGFDTLKIDTHSLIYKRFRTQLDMFAEKSNKKFGISHFILIDGFNFGFELMGATETYMLMVESPDLLKQVIDFAFEVNVLVQDAFFDGGVLFNGGTCSNMFQWVGGRIVSESVDPFHMTSVDDFEKWGREPIERIFDRFDGGVTHIHGNGRHLLEAVCEVGGLKGISLHDDTGFAQAFDILPSIRSCTGDMPLAVNCEFDEFRRALYAEKLVGGVLYNVCSVPDESTANKIMDKVRKYRC